MYCEYYCKGGKQMSNIREVAAKTVEAMQMGGMVTHTAWSEYGHSFLPIIRLHEMREKELFDREIVTEFVREIEKSYETGKISLGTYQYKKRGAQRLTEFHDTGKLEWSTPGRVSKFVLNEYYEKIISNFIAGEDVSTKTKRDITWVSKKYFSWLIQEGHQDLRNVGATEVQGFMIYCSRHMASSGVHNIKLYMKKLYRYLVSQGYGEEDYDGLFSFSISRESKLYPAVSPEEINLTLEIIDRRTPQGKRDYAMVLLGAVMGLRAIDIIKMKLTDIDWKRGEIRIIQSKTGKPLALPLTKDVGEAVSEYILKARPKTDYDNVFLRVRGPHRPFANAVSIGDIYDYYRKRAGLPRDAHDGMGFHSLRRSLGKSLVTSGAPITMVAQILGDSDLDSTKKYISLDSEHLKECALGFDGIKPKRGVMSI